MSDSDYQAMLGTGWVVRRPEFPELWRASMRTQGRANGVRVRTGYASSDHTIAWAVLVDYEALEPEPLAEVAT